MSTINLTPRNIALLGAVLKHMNAELDFTAVATEANMKTAKYARDEWKKLREKLVLGTTMSEGEGDSPAKKTKTTPAKRAANGTGAKKTPAKKAKLVKEEDEEAVQSGGGDDDELAGDDTAVKTEVEFEFDADST